MKLSLTRQWTCSGVIAVGFALLLAGGATPSPDPAAVGGPETPASTAAPAPTTAEGDPANADDWRYCSMDGFLASTCGGTASSCPPGTLMSPVGWVGTCRNPEDGQDYIVSYNDCCGKGSCGGSFVHRNEGDKPVYYPYKSNDVGWCMGSADAAYNSTVSIVLGVADAPDH